MKTTPFSVEQSFGRAFKSLINPEYLQKEREKKLAGFNDKLMVVALRNDKVIPVEGIKIATGEKFSKTKRFTVIDFPYSYIHENPFPLLYKKIEGQVEEAFNSVFNPIVQFYGN